MRSCSGSSFLFSVFSNLRKNSNCYSRPGSMRSYQSFNHTQTRYPLQQDTQRTQIHESLNKTSPWSYCHWLPSVLRKAGGATQSKLYTANSGPLENAGNSRRIGSDNYWVLYLHTLGFSLAVRETGRSTGEILSRVSSRSAFSHV